MKTRKCKYCEKTFRITKTERIYCSFNCRKKWNKAMQDYNRKSYPKRKNKILKYIKKYHKSPKGILARRKSIRIYRRKYLLDSNNKLIQTLRNRLNHSLKGKLKSISVKKLLGCSLSLFRKHLQKQFKKGMTWNNHGKWHIDHIRPCASFDLSKTSEQKKCFHYTNLQPLWAEENFRKNKKRGR